MNKHLLIYIQTKLTRKSLVRNKELDSLQKNLINYFDEFIEKKKNCFICHFKEHIFTFMSEHPLPSNAFKSLQA